MTDRDSFATLLRQYRLEAGLTQEALAERAFVSAKSIGSLERDRSRLPRLETVRVLAEALALDEERRERLLLAARPGVSVAAELAPAPAAFPHPSTRLYGRDLDLDLVERLLAQAFDGAGPRLIVLTGAGGVGKTRLALAAANRATTRTSVTPVFIDLTSTAEPSLVLDAVARQVGITGRDTTPLQTRLIALLRQRPHLLLIDNVEHLLDARDTFLMLLDECPALVLLATSRVALDVRAERRVRIEPLETPIPNATVAELVRSAPVNLFLDRARAAGWDGDSSEELATIAAICHRLDGLPLAIELAAAWTGIFPPAELWRRLERRLPVLSRGRRDMPERHRTIQGAIAWSYDLLDRDAQATFRRICIFENDADLSLVCALLGESDHALACEEQLAELADHSLIQWRTGIPGGEPGLRILETIREFGLDLLDQTGGLSEVALAHTDLMQSIVDRQAALLGGPDEAAALQFLDRAYPNIRTALNRCIRDGDRYRRLRFVAALWRFWLLSGALAEGSALSADAIALIDEVPSSRADLELEAIAGAALLAIELGDLESASHFVEPVLADVGGQPPPAVALYAAGLLSAQRGDPARGQSFLELALQRARAESDHRTEIAVLAALGANAFQTGDQEGAARFEAERLARCQAVGDKRGIAAGQKNLALHAMFAGRLGEASRLGTEAAETLRSLGDTGILAEVLWALGHTAYLQGALDRAAQILYESYALRQSRGDELNAAKSSGALAVVELARGNLQQARALVESADRPLRAQRDGFGLAMNSLVRGHVEIASGAFDIALPLLDEGGRLLLEMNNLLYLPWYLEGLASIAAVEADWTRVAALLGARVAVMRRIGVPLPPIDEISLERVQSASERALAETAFAASFSFGTEDPIAVARQQLQCA